MRDKYTILEEILQPRSEQVIFLVRHGFLPFVGGILAGDFDGDVRKPAISFRPVPMLDIRGDDDDIARFQAARRLAPFPVPALSRNAKEDLPAALVGMMGMPVVAAGRLERDVCKKRRDARSGSLSSPSPIITAPPAAFCSGRRFLRSYSSPFFSPSAFLPSVPATAFAV